MACKECENIESYNCGCKESEHCNCKIQLSTVCILYEGVKLTLLDTYEGENLESVLKKVEDLFQEIFELIQSKTYKNIGLGAKVYKKINFANQVEFRTILSSSSITVLENLSDIGISINEQWLYNFIVNADVETTTDITDTVTGKRIATYTNEDGIVQNIFETITTLTDNNNGSFTYTNEQGVPSTYSVASAVSNVNITNTKAGNTIGIFNNINNNSTNINETITTLSKSGNTLTYTNESGGTSNYIPLDSSTTEKGIVQRATPQEVSAKANVNKYVSPSDIDSVVAGGLDVATQAEANALTAVDKIITPGRIPKATTTQEGIVRFATQAEVDAGTSDNLLISPNTLNQTIQSSALIFTKYFEFNVNSWATYSNLAISHGFGFLPKMAQATLVAKNTSLGYEVGEEICIEHVNITRPDTPQWYGIRTSFTSQLLKVRVGLSIPVPSGTQAANEKEDTSTNFSIRVRLFG